MASAASLSLITTPITLAWHIAAGNNGRTVYVRPEELAAARAAGLLDPSAEAVAREYFGRNGMSANDIDWYINDVMRSFSACAIPRKTRTPEHVERIVIGRYTFEVLIQGGHSVAQVALHDPSAGIFFSGDQMLERITPNVGLWPYGDTYPIENYFRSLDEIESGISGSCCRGISMSTIPMDAGPKLCVRTTGGCSPNSSVGFGGKSPDSNSRKLFSENNETSRIRSRRGGNLPICNGYRNREVVRHDDFHSRGMKGPFDEGDFSGKVALVWWSMGGIGRTIAEEFARSGADIVIHGLTRRRGRSVKTGRRVRPEVLVHENRTVGFRMIC